MMDPAEVRRVLRNQRIIICLQIVVLLMMIAGWRWYIYLPAESEQMRAEETRDTDHDGYTDIAERAAGTDPNDPQNFPGSHATFLIAQRDIAKGEVITENMLASRSAAVYREAPLGAVMGYDKNTIIGCVSKRFIHRNEFFFLEMIISASPWTFD